MKRREIKREPRVVYRTRRMLGNYMIDRFKLVSITDKTVTFISGDGSEWHPFTNVRRDRISADCCFFLTKKEAAEHLATMATLHKHKALEAVIRADAYLKRYNTGRILITTSPW